MQTIYRIRVYYFTLVFANSTTYLEELDQTKLYKYFSGHLTDLVAQLVEILPSEPKVVGATPTRDQHLSAWTGLLVAFPSVSMYLNMYIYVDMFL